jgi:hypothetical protein
MPKHTLIDTVFFNTARILAILKLHDYTAIFIMSFEISNTIDCSNYYHIIIGNAEGLSLLEDGEVWE